MPGNSFKNKELASRAGSMSKPGKHERTKQWEALGEKITGEITDKVIEYLDSLPPDEMFKSYLLLLEYFKPKLSRSEVKAEIEDTKEKHVVISFKEEDIDLGG